MQDADRLADFNALGSKLASTLAALADPEARASGSDAASLARTRRVMGDMPGVDRVAELQSDYDVLGAALEWSSGSGAAAVAQERRMIRKLLDVLAAPEGVAKVDELESRRAARSAASGAPRRRRKSG